MTVLLPWQSLELLVTAHSNAVYTVWLQMCPFYLARDLLPMAQVIFMPYNYLLDQHVSLESWFEAGGAASSQRTVILLQLLAAAMLASCKINSV
jgi:hypothetical protein